MTPEEAKALELGQAVRFTGVLIRDVAQDDKDPNRLVKSWRRWPYLPYPTGHTGPTPKELEGIVVGLRSLNNGATVWNGWEEGASFTRDGAQAAVLVAWHKRRKLVHVAPEDLEMIQ